MNYFINGFKQGLFGTFNFLGKNASVLMLFISVIEYYRQFYIASINSLLVAILFALWDIQKEIKDKN